MTWHAQPSGPYIRSSTDAMDNMYEIKGILQGTYNYTLQAVAGVLGNIQAESGFNPWRWQSDRVNTSNGYGLYQYTPATGYLNLSGTTPNMSTSQITTGATPQDGARQTDCFASNELSKWVSSAWRSYWDTTTYATIYAKRNQWLQQFGNGSSITMAQFAVVTDIEAATFFMLACFEGPRNPNLAARYANAQACYDIINSGPTPPPTPPTPPGPGGGGGNLGYKCWLCFGIRNNNSRIFRGLFS